MAAGIAATEVVVRQLGEYLVDHHYAPSTKEHHLSTERRFLRHLARCRADIRTAQRSHVDSFLAADRRRFRRRYGRDPQPGGCDAAPRSARRRWRRSSPSRTARPAWDSVAMHFLHCSTTPAPGSKKFWASRRPPCISTHPPRCGCSARAARSASARCGPRPLRCCGRSWTASPAASTRRSSPIATAPLRLWRAVPVAEVRRCGCEAPSAPAGEARHAAHFLQCRGRVPRRGRRRCDRDPELAWARPPRYDVPLCAGERRDQAPGDRAGRWRDASGSAATLEAGACAAGVARFAVRPATQLGETNPMSRRQVPGLDRYARRRTLHPPSPLGVLLRRPLPF
jgi:hypothetical protein